VIDLGDGVEVTANVTNEALKDLALTRGRDAIALVKASFVTLATDRDVRTSAGNAFVGKVKSIARGPVNSEVRLAIGATRTLVAVVSTQGLDGLGLRRDDSCRAWVNSSHVLVAVND
jgi:molybdate transport system regulatory protein